MWYKVKITLFDSTEITETRQAANSQELVAAVFAERPGTVKSIKAWLCAAPEE
jgi:hypothetical protein